MTKKKEIVKTKTKLFPTGNAMPEQPGFKGRAAAGIVVSFNPSFHIPLIESLAREGATTKEIAEYCGVDVRSFAVWRQKFAIVDEALLQSRRLAVAVIESAMFKTAIGGEEFEEKSTLVGVDGLGREYAEERTSLKKTLPNVKAQMFLLKNLAPERYRERHEIEQTGGINVTWNEVREELPEEVKRQIKVLPLSEFEDEGEDE